MKKSDRNLIYQKFDGRCAYCGCELGTHWHVDHLKPIIRNRRYSREKHEWVYDGTCEYPELDIIENMVPACASCNINKHSSNLESFRSLIKGFVNSLNRDSAQYRLAKKYGLIQETGNKVEFYFEKVNQINHESKRIFTKT